jgi:hypothetical protein
VLVVGDGVVLRELEDADEGLQQRRPEPRVVSADEGRGVAQQPKRVRSDSAGVNVTILEVFSPKKMYKNGHFD